MLKRFSGKKPGARIKPDTHNMSLIEPFTAVRTLSDCEEAFQTAGLLTGGSISTDAIPVISDQLRALRARGLGLEPNLVGRTAPRFFSDSQIRGQASLLFSLTDTDFIELRRQADEDRDAGRFGSAQFYYWRSLELFPYHSAVLVQYGHSLKEQGLHADALIAYMDAYIFGADKTDVEVHLLFVAEKTGLWQAANRLLLTPRTAQSAMHARASSSDVITLTQFFLGRGCTVKERATWMCKYASKLEFVHFLISESDFKNTHRRFLQLLSDTQLIAE